MATPELAKPKEIILNQISVERVGDKQAELLPQLAQIYFQTWQAEGLCPSLTEAADKMAAFNPQDTYVVIDPEGKIYALIQTLPVNLPSLAYLPYRFPTYKSVETASARRQKADNPNYLICFSINALPGYRVTAPEGETQSLARFLLTHLPTACVKVAYSRFCHYDGPALLDFYLKNLGNSQKLGAVGMHENLGGLTVAIIAGSRPEDMRGGGANVIVLYPKNEPEAAKITTIKAARRLHPPPTLIQNNHCLFLDV